MNKDIVIALSDIPEAKKAIRRRLKEIGMTQADLAHRLEVTRPYVNSMLTGKRRVRISKLNEVCAILGMPDVPGVSGHLASLHLLSPRYGKSEFMRDEVWLAINRYTPYFDVEGIRSFDRYLDSGTKYTFWGGPSSDVRVLGLILRDKKRDGQVSCIQGPSWLECLSFKIYSPLGSCPTNAEYVMTRDQYYAGTQKIDDSAGQLICRNLIPPYLQLRNGEKVEGFEVV